MNPSIYKKSGVYDFFMKSLGFESSIDRFLKRLAVELPENARILDAGCGTGLLGLHFLERFPTATLWSTDLESNFLDATLTNAKRRNINEARIRVFQSDITSPRQVTDRDGQSQTLADESFDLICIGAVVGYAAETAESVRELLALLKPGGTLINLEMNESPTGRFVAHRYQYNNISIVEIVDAIGKAGCEHRIQKFGFGCLPAKLTRVAVIATKPA